jgi:DNA-binding NarL/FixJ family response regulator
MTVTVAVVDDHPAIVAAMAYWYSTSETTIEIVAAGPTDKAAWVPPGDTADVVVLDLQLSGQDPDYSTLRRLVDAGRQVVVYTMREDQQTALTCMDLGACTILTKSRGDEHLIEATLAAAQNRPFTPPTLAGAFGTDTGSGRPQLSQRELDVLIEWFQSESKELVAAKLGISTTTVRTYLDRVRIKYANVGRSARTKTNLVARALEDGLVRLEDL